MQHSPSSDTPYRLDDFPDPPPAPELNGHAVVRHSAESGIGADKLVGRALDRAYQDGRHAGGLWLACQLRDNGFGQGEAESAVRQYHASCPKKDHPYDVQDAINAIRDAYRKPPREAWATPGVEIPVTRHTTENTATSESAEPGENLFTKGLIRASELPPAVPPQPLFYGLYPRALTLDIGETGAGKTSLSYNIAIHAALGEPLWDMKFLHPLNVLFIDPENSGSYREDVKHGGLCAVRLKRIGKRLPDNLYFHDGLGVNLSNAAHMEQLAAFITERNIDLLIIDPLANLFNTDDENDNAEAARQMKRLIALSRTTGVCIRATHHTGKREGGIYGRGASARLAAADVGIVFRARGAEDEETDDTYTGDTHKRTDVCRVQIVKDRLGWFGRSSIYLRMNGDDGFDLATFEDWAKGQPAGKDPDKVRRARVEIMDHLRGLDWEPRASLLTVLENSGIGRNSGDKALKELDSEGVIESRAEANNAKSYRLKRSGDRTE